MADEPFVQYSPGKIATAFDLEHGLHDAFKHREEREMSGGGDSEGAETWLVEANGQEDDSGDSDGTLSEKAVRMCKELIELDR